MPEDLIKLIESYGAACRNEGVAAANFAAAKRQADSLLERLRDVSQDFNASQTARDGRNAAVTQTSKIN